MKTKARFYVSLILIVVLFVPTLIAAAAPAQGRFRLAADSGWVVSGFYVEAGDQVTLTAHGQAITAPINIFDSGSVSGPDGQLAICPNYEGSPDCAMNNASFGALVAKIGEDGTPFYIGSNLTFVADSTGDLYLAVNDLLPFYDDNHGNFMVFFSY